MRKSRAVTGEPAAPSSAAPAPTAAASAASAATAFDGTLHILHGGEAAVQVAAELAEEARKAGLLPHVLPMNDFKTLSLDRRAVLTCIVLTLKSSTHVSVF